MFANPMNAEMSSAYTEESKNLYATAQAALQRKELNPIKTISWGSTGEYNWIKIIIDFHGIDLTKVFKWKKQDNTRAGEHQEIWKMLQRSKAAFLDAKQAAKGHSPLMWRNWWE